MNVKNGLWCIWGLHMYSRGQGPAVGKQTAVWTNIDEAAELKTNWELSLYAVFKKV